MKHLTAFRKQLERTQYAPNIEITNEQAALLIADIVESERILAMLNSPDCITVKAGLEYRFGNQTMIFFRNGDSFGAKVKISAPPLWRRIAGVFNPKYLFKKT